MKVKNMRLLSLFLAFAFPCGLASAHEPPKIVEVRKIWDLAPHNAFTDLVRYRDRWFCTFREGQEHASADGALRVITSLDGVKWESATQIRLASKGFADLKPKVLPEGLYMDLRDPRLCITPDGRLMLNSALAYNDGRDLQSLAWFSDDGKVWSKAVLIGEHQYWLWRATWHKGMAYGVGRIENKRVPRLYESKDGTHFEVLVKDADFFPHVPGPSEATIRFLSDDTALCLLRLNNVPGSKTANAHLGRARPPYTRWEWKDLGAPIGGPNLIQLPDGRFVAGVRLYDKKARTALCWLDPTVGKLTEFLTLPSGGDTSYAGLVQHDGLLWVSYYSSHEGKASIYLAKVQIPAMVRDIGSRQELFVDDDLIDTLKGVELKMHTPVAQDIAIVCDAPWEGNTSAYFTLFADGDRFRMYYRGAHFDVKTKKEAHPEYACYAESKDGIRWGKPKLGLFACNGSKENNIIWAGTGTHNFTPFKDSNPKAPASSRYKALAGGRGGLIAYQSADGIRWSSMHDKAVITDGAFDSQNLAFWDDVRGEYRAYWRFFDKTNGHRAIRTATSKDFIRWENQADLRYGVSPSEHLYTNAIQNYFRAPHLFLGFPTRFQPKHQQVEPILMTSRDGLNFKRWPQPLIPITAPEDRAGNRSNYMTSGLLQLPGKPNEVSVYATEAYYAGPGSRVRRFTFRTDGFVSLQAGANVGEMITKPLRFSGRELCVNYLTSAGGSLRLELQDEAGKPLPGFALGDCKALGGDSIEQKITWAKGSAGATLAGQTVRLRFVMQNADLYALQFKK